MTYSAIEFEDRDVKEELVGFKSIEWKSRRIYRSQDEN
jgi:hypothetical protein